jgi:hypothetical protein
MPKREPGLELVVVVEGDPEELGCGWVAPVVLRPCDHLRKVVEPRIGVHYHPQESSVAVVAAEDH